MAAPTLALAEADVLAYLKAHPEALPKAEAALAAYLPKKDRCYVSVALGASGVVLGLASAFHYVSPSFGAVGASIAASAGVLIAQFCGKIP